MKIALLSTFFHPVTGGVESHVYDLSEKLSEAGHDVEVLCSNSTKIGPTLSSGRFQYSKVKGYRFKVLLSLSYYHKLAPGIFWHLLTHKYDVIHVHGFRKFDTYIALFTSIFTKSKVVLTTHNPFAATSYSLKQKILLRLHDATFGKIFTKHLHKIIVLVDSENAIMVNKFNVKPSNIVTIGDAINDIYFTQGNKELVIDEYEIDTTKWKAIALSAGRINEDKGFQNLVHAISTLKKVLFIITGGDDGYLDKLKKIYVGYDNVIITGKFVTPDKLLNYYDLANIFLMPSHHEAFGMVMTEAMAQGLAVVSTNVGGPSEIFSDKVAILQDPKDQQKWTENIKFLLENPDKMLELQENGKKFANTLSWKKILPKILECYK